MKLKYQRVCKRCNQRYRTSMKNSDICYNCHEGAGCGNKSRMKDKSQYKCFLP
jgi:hypothetical protein